MKQKIITTTKYLIIIAVCLGLGAWRLKSAFTLDSYDAVEGKVYYTKVDVGSFSAGNVIALNVKEGDYVKKGDLLLEIDNQLIRERLRGMKEATKANFSPADYYELQKKIDNFKMYAPEEGYIINLNISKNSYIKESDYILTIVPKNSFRYSVILPEEMKVLPPGTTLKVMQLTDKTQTEGKVEGVLPILIDNKIDKTKLRMLIVPRETLDNVSQLNQDIEILFPRETFAKKTYEQLQTFARNRKK